MKNSLRPRLIKAMKPAFVIAVFAGVVLVAISQFASAKPPNPELSGPTITEGGRASSGSEALHLMIGNLVPGFGGWYLDSATLVVNLQDPREIEQFQSVVQALAEEDKKGIGGILDFISEVRSEPAEFLFSDLVRWKDLMSRSAGYVPQLVAVDADERANRVTLGVSNEAGVPLLLDVAASWGIPQRALNFVIETEPTVRVQTTLNQAWTPPAGGVQIRPATGGYCTLGIGIRIYYFGWSQGYLTAAHCINDNTLTHGVTGDNFYQPAPGRPYGGVFLNQPWNSTDPSCGSYSLCTTADAMYLNGIIPNTARHVKVTPIGSTTVTGQDSVDASVFPAVGMLNLRRVGATSGTSYGNVLATCENRVSSGPLGPLMNLCVDRVGGSVSGGDSGGLATWPNASGLHQFMGIVLASAPGGYIITNWPQILATLGYFDIIP